MVTWLVSRGDRGVGVSTRNRLGGILSEIIAPVESSLSDSVLKTVFLLGSDYSLSEPQALTCGDVRAHARPVTAFTGS